MSVSERRPEGDWQVSELPWISHGRLDGMCQEHKPEATYKEQSMHTSGRMRTWCSMRKHEGLQRRHGHVFEVDDAGMRGDEPPGDLTGSAGSALCTG